MFLLLLVLVLFENLSFKTFLSFFWSIHRQYAICTQLSALFVSECNRSSWVQWCHLFQDPSWFSLLFFILEFCFESFFHKLPYCTGSWKTKIRGIFCRIMIWISAIMYNCIYERISLTYRLRYLVYSRICSSILVPSFFCI